MSTRPLPANLKRIATSVLLAGLCASCASTQQLRPFKSDGCSLFPDGFGGAPELWHDCCVAHDRAYWRGGDAGERQQADQSLQACVLERSGSETLAQEMYRGVRLGGAPWLPTWYRWGYGWNYGRGYQSLTEDERRQADALLKSVAPSPASHR